MAFIERYAGSINDYDEGGMASLNTVTILPMKAYI